MNNLISKSSDVGVSRKKLGARNFNSSQTATVSGCARNFDASKAKKFCVVFIAFAAIFAIAILLTSCSFAKAELSESVSGDSAMATVKSVDGNKLTVSVMSGGGDMQGQGGGDMQGGQGQGGDMQGGQNGQGGTPPDLPSGDSQGGQSANGQSGQGGQAGQGETPPAKPDGDTSGNGQSGQSQGNSQGQNGQSQGNSQGQGGQGGTPPELPSGDGQSGQGGMGGQGGGMQGGQGGQGGDMQGGMGGGQECTLTINDTSIIEKDGGEKGSLDDIQEGTMLQLTVENGKNVTKITIGSSMQNSSSGNVNNGTSAVTYSTDTTESGKTYSSSNADENAVRAQDSATVELNNCTYDKTGDSTSSEDSDFYGLNAVIYAWNQAKMRILGGKITSDSSGSNGVFCYGSGSTIDISDAQIRTSKGNSGGIEVSGGGTINATNLDIETQGQSCAAIRSDRGGGTENVEGGSYKALGQGSPAIYCTANVNVKNAYLESETSEVNVIEGKNSINLEGCTLNSNTQGKYFRGDNIRNVMLYQSMSGDAEQGTCNYTAKDCKFTANFGNIFYVTNTSAVVNLENTEFSGSYEAFMKVAGNTENWGNSSSNGGTVELNCTNQKITGPITVDSLSKLTMKLTSGSSFNGTINADGNQGQVAISLDDNSTFTLTGDTYVTSVEGNTSGINLNGHNLYVNGQLWSK